jgi:hypothetical protein
MTDPKYLKMLGKAADYFFGGSIHDEMWRML